MAKFRFSYMNTAGEVREIEMYASSWIDAARQATFLGYDDEGLNKIEFVGFVK
jgi:hypothetical protein